MLPVAEIGWKAHEALTATRGRARVLARLQRSTYLTAGDTIVWLARSGSLRHPRAVHSDASLDSDDDVACFQLDGARCWRADSSKLPASASARIVAGCRGLRSSIDAVGIPDGFGAILSGETPIAERARAPWDRELMKRGSAAARALASACVADDSARAVDSVTPLLGLGPGLTPSGDDYVGGAFFARMLLARAGAASLERWAEAGVEVVARARGLTHPISVALLADLVAGDGPEPLHDLARALADGAPLGDVVAAAQRLVAIGHSSGWDILAGFVGGLIGDPPMVQ